MGNKIKLKRNELKLTIYQVAETTGLSPTYISNLENEYRDNPSREVMSKIAKVLKTTVQELFF